MGEDDRRLGELLADDMGIDPQRDRRIGVPQTGRHHMHGHALIHGLESATRSAGSKHDQAEARELLGDTYQATAAMMAKIGETDAAWIAADRAAFCVEQAGKPLAVAASMFRMAQVFLVLGHIDQAHHVATSMAHALEPKITPAAGPEALSLYGAAHLVLAVAAARNNERSQAHDHLDTARTIAQQLGEDRDSAQLRIP